MGRSYGHRGDSLLKNVMMAGGLLQIAAFGAGALSIDNRAKNTAPYTEAAVTSVRLNSNSARLLKNPSGLNDCWGFICRRSEPLGSA